MGPTSHSLLAPAAACECYCRNLVFPLWIHPHMIRASYALSKSLEQMRDPPLTYPIGLYTLAILANPEPSSPLKEL